MPTRPKLLLFDLDGVLAAYSRDVRCSELALAIGVAPQDVHRALFKHGWEARSDRGELDLSDYMDALRTGYGWTVSEEVFITARRAATVPNRAVLVLCERLSTQAALGLFTNNGRWLIENAEATIPELLPLFGRRLVCSGGLGLCKPDPDAFTACVVRLGFAASSACMIDDIVENADGARAAGLEAIRFDGADMLAAALRDAGFDC